MNAIPPRILLAALFGLAVLMRPVVGAQVPADTPRQLVLLVRYADGRTTVRPVGSRVSFWTPGFARTPETNPHVRALDINGARDGDDAVLTVSVMLDGVGAGDRRPIAQVRVSLGSPVEVPELQSFGIPPIRLSLMLVERAFMLRAPQVLVPSGNLEIEVSQAASSSRPSYRVIVTNHAAVALRAFEFRTRRDGKEEVSGRRKDLRDEPLVGPGASYAFDVPVSARTSEQASAGAWSDWDVFDVTSVLWDDGLVEGSETLKTSEWRSCQDKLTLMPVVLQWLREAQALSFADASRSFDARTNAEHNNLLRSAVLEDLAMFRQSHPADDANAFHQWARGATADYQRWSARLTRLVQP